MGGLGDLAYFQMDHVASLKTAQGRLWEHLADCVGFIRSCEHVMGTSDPAARKVQRYLDAVRDALASPFEELYKQLNNPDSSYPHKIGKAERILKQCWADLHHKLLVVGMYADVDLMLSNTAVPVGPGIAHSVQASVQAPAAAARASVPLWTAGQGVVPPHTAAHPLPMQLPLQPPQPQPHPPGGSGAPSTHRHIHRQPDDTPPWAPAPARWWVLLDHGWSGCDAGNSAELEGAFVGGRAAVRWARGSYQYSNLDIILDHVSWKKSCCSQLQTAPHTPHAMICPTCVPGAAWYLKSDVVPNSRLQVRADV